MSASHDEGWRDSRRRTDNIDQRQCIVDIIRVNTDSADSDDLDWGTGSICLCSLLFHLLFTIKLLKKFHIVIKVVWFVEDWKEKDIELMRELFS